MNEIDWLNLPLIEWIGYIASTLVLVSLSLSSLVKLRIFNFFGSAIFSFYGFYIGALPVGWMNLFIALFNIYYLRFLLFKKELFDVVKASDEDAFLKKYLTYHQSDIKHFFPHFEIAATKNTQILLALRNATVAGVFIVAERDNKEGEILLDYVSPQFRDYKTGRFLLHKYQSHYANNDIEELVCRTTNKQHIKYVTKMGFQLDEASHNYRLRIQSDR
jgi:ribosomal protein S18 acetylase RimI-like enzyme